MAAEYELGTDDPWAEIDGYPVEDWQLEVAEDNTRLGYLAWVQHQQDIKAEEADGTD